MTTSARSIDRSPERTRVEALMQQARASARGIPALIARLKEPNWSARRELIAALAALGAEALEPLCMSLEQDRSNETHIAAVVDALVASVADTERALSRLANSSNPAVVADVAQILGRRRKTQSVPSLIAFLNHTDDNVAAAAIEALGRVGGRAAVDALVAAVERDSFFRTYPAIDVLGRSGDPRAVAPLARLLSRPQYTFEAALALGRTADKGAVPPLLGLLLSKELSDVRLAALALAELLEVHGTLYGSTDAVLEALRRQAPPEAVPRLVEALDAADAVERIAICTVLGALQLVAAAPALVSLLDEPNVASAAAAALARLGPLAAEHVRHAALTGDSARRRIVLPLLTHDSDTSTVLQCLQDSDPSVRAAACDALASMGAASAVGTLFAHLNDQIGRAHV
jgi:HEAT repeat protein